MNDHTPQCAEASFDFSAAEANSLQIELGSVTATDGDSVAGLLPVGSGQLSYRLASSTVDRIFSVSPMVSLALSYYELKQHIIANSGCCVW